MLGGLAVLADRGVFPWWPVIVIAVREFGISLYRSIAGRRGIVLPAQRLGKYKAFLQYCAVGFVLLPITADWYTFQDIVLTPQSCSRSCPGCRSSATATSTGNGKRPEPVDPRKARRRAM